MNNKSLFLHELLSDDIICDKPKLSLTSSLTLATLHMQHPSQSDIFLKEWLECPDVMFDI